jgi:KDO2-lipid IV(A) lauroyltransferase
MRMVGSLPLKFHYFWADSITWLLKNIVHYRYSVVYTNLARSFPQLKYWELDKIAKDFYKHFAEMFAETIWFAGCYHKPERLRKQRIMEVVNQEVFNETYDAAPSVTVLTSHCGNWELLGGICSYNFNDNVPVVTQEHLYVVYKELHNKVSDEVFKMNRRSPMVGYEGMLESKEILRFVMNNKDRKIGYYIIGDQYPYQTKVEVDGLFLNQKTLGMIAAFKLACKLSHAVLFARIDREERGHYKLKYEKICDNASDFTPEQLMRKYFDLLEEQIKDDPSNWLWTHKRWKYKR